MLVCITRYTSFVYICVFSQPFVPMKLGLLDLSTCGSSKGCYRNPPDCNRETCEMVVTWKVKGDNVEFELSGKSDGWVAVGFSKDKFMVGLSHTASFVCHKVLLAVHLYLEYEKCWGKKGLETNDKILLFVYFIEIILLTVYGCTYVKSVVSLILGDRETGWTDGLCGAASSGG